jgi:hypothetical protein
VGEFAKLLGGALRVLERFADEGRRVRGVAFERLVRQFERDDSVDKPLLCAVVQVAHNSPPFLVGCGHKSGSRGGQFSAGVDVRERGGDRVVPARSDGDRAV